ncbi:hypothetical protein Btru_054218 [Bulinus truncatus]|nr:hypothetical protein Btru_054218 [Bulinus truncatus]
MTSSTCVLKHEPEKRKPDTSEISVAMEASQQVKEMEQEKHESLSLSARELQVIKAVKFLVTALEAVALLLNSFIGGGRRTSSSQAESTTGCTLPGTDSSVVEIEIDNGGKRRNLTGLRRFLERYVIKKSASQPWLYSWCLGLLTNVLNVDFQAAGTEDSMNISFWTLSLSDRLRPHQLFQMNVCLFVALSPIQEFIPVRLLALSGWLYCYLYIFLDNLRGTQTYMLLGRVFLRHQAYEVQECVHCQKNCATHDLSFSARELQMIKAVTLVTALEAVAPFVQQRVFFGRGDSVRVLPGQEVPPAARYHLGCRYRRGERPHKSGTAIYYCVQFKIQRDAEERF